MSRIGFWLSLILPALVVTWGAWWGSFPLGVAGEWEWKRVEPTEALGLALIPPAVAAAIFLGFVWLGARRIELCRTVERATWVAGLCVAGFIWLWVVQESAPQGYQLSKAAWVLYFRGSSGYYSEASEKAQNLPAYLAGYEAEMAKGDYLHLGTHPPGLVVNFRGLLSLCKSSPLLTSAILATEPESVTRAFEALQQSSRRQNALPRPDHAALWLASLLLQGGVVLAIVPLYALLRQTSSRRASWLAAAFWPTAPALAVFLPKSDCLYPLIALTFLWIWNAGLDRRSGPIGALTGLTLWLGMFLSLAFLPVALMAVLATLGKLARQTDGAGSDEDGSNDTKGTGRILSVKNLKGGLRPVASFIAWGAAGFAIPTLLVWLVLKLNLIAVWRMNFANHAAFYEHYPRSYGKWLLVNPLEFAVATGVPLAVLAGWSFVRHWRMSCAAPGTELYWNALRHSSKEASVANRQRADLRGLPSCVWAWLVVLGLLWISGKNMGEAARLWIILMPFVAWAAGPLFERTSHPAAAAYGGAHQAASNGDVLPGLSWTAALALQLVTTAAIVTRVVGFHYP